MSARQSDAVPATSSEGVGAQATAASTRQPAPPSELDVVVIGAGPVGSALALELASRGVRVAAVEKDPALDPNQVRAMNISMRTLEHFRRWGLVDDLRGRAGVAPEWQRDVVFCTSLLGEQLVAFPGYGWRSEDSRPLAAEPAQVLPQPETTASLRRGALARGAGIATGWECTEIVQHDQGVSALVRDSATGAEQRISARYAVGCDGGHSIVREAAGISRSGTDVIAKHFLIIVRSPGLLERVSVGPGVFFLTMGAQDGGFAVPLDAERWSMEFTGFPLDHPFDIPEQERLIRGTIGAEHPFEILSASTYYVRDLIVERYREGRLFLAGDAAHLFPPYGGHNMNTGIGDAVDLGWKLAAVINGWGGEALLDSYGTERRPMALRNAGVSLSNVKKLYEAEELAAGSPIPLDAGADEARRDLGERLRAMTRPEWLPPGVSLDMRYVDSPVVVDDGSVAPGWKQTEYAACAKPGHRLPHTWLKDGASIFDRCGPDLTLLVLAPAADDVERFIRDAQAARVPLTVLQLVDEPGLRALYGADLVLIRPDQHVAWRGSNAPQSPRSVLDVVRGVAVGAR